MSFGDLRNEVLSDFAEFLSAHGFKEVFYDYDEKVFGNEILQFANDETGIQFTRDRSIVDIELKGKTGLYTPIFLVLEKIGITRPPVSFDTHEKHGFGYDQLIPQWPRLRQQLVTQT